MPIYIAPGIYNRILDASLYIPQLSSSILGIVGTFKKGKVNYGINDSDTPTELKVMDATPTLITSQNQFIEVFGEPLRGSDGWAAHAALYFLRFGNQLRVARATDLSARKSKSTTIVGSDSIAANLGVIRAINEGIWANGLQVVISTDTIADEDGNITTVYRVQVFDIGADVASDSPLETYDSIDFETLTEERYVEKIINEQSNYIDFDFTTVGPPTEGTYILASGVDGYESMTSTIIRNAADIFVDPTTVDINLLSAPGWNHDINVALKLQTICKTRGDVMAVLDTPDVDTAQEMVDFVRGIGVYSTVIPSTWETCIYGPWIQILDEYNDEKQWVPPSVRVLGAFAYNDSVEFPWFAVAGSDRGVLLDTLDVRFNLTRGDIEAIYGSQNHINPIRKTVDGIIIDGNKTLYRKPSLLNNIHVVRMVLYAQKTMATATRYLQWQPHDDKTWRQYKAIVNPALRYIAQNRGLDDFYVKCDAETNTAYFLDNNQMMAELHLVPTATVEKLVNDYIIHSHGVELRK